MIAWMSDWLKQVILVILLAAFVDLLMPNNGLQRYVRTVLGLFILLTLLTPIFTLFQKTLDTRKMLASVEQLPALVGADRAGTMTAMKPLGAVLQEAGSLKAAQEQQAMQLLETRLGAELQSSMEALPGVKVKTIDVTIQADNNGKPVIRTMQAILYRIDGTVETAQPTGSEKEVRTVEPVRPVQIQIKVGDSRTGAGASADGGSALSDSEQQAKSRVYELLTQQWQLKRTQIQLDYESEQRKAR
ncbi:stage III sporulation protein AF [Paenibacillus koleovorans]|uniref:stage III sporulation protein AF n=1 Tax=Paenibacillus koleovorans TaxID=121608 RepID=UPI000FDB72FD|nr:stage III sporulation protein AF [Paenibacillus koleovorans]